MVLMPHLLTFQPLFANQYVAVALEVVARRPRPQVEALLEVADEALADHLGGGHAGVVGPGPAAGQLAELALVRDELRGQEAGLEAVLQADRALALALLADLKENIR